MINSDLYKQYNLSPKNKVKGIYIFKDNNKRIVYVGSSCDIYTRLCKHKSNMMKQNNHNQDLYNWLNNNDFTVEIFSTVDYKKVEADYIDLYKPILNKNKSKENTYLCELTGENREKAYHKEYNKEYHKEHKSNINKDYQKQYVEQHKKKIYSYNNSRDMRKCEHPITHKIVSYRVVRGFYATHKNEDICKGFTRGTQFADYFLI